MKKSIPTKEAKENSLDSLPSLGSVKSKTGCCCWVFYISVTVVLFFVVVDKQSIGFILMTLTVSVSHVVDFKIR